jgi:hypothetical protein
MSVAERMGINVDELSDESDSNGPALHPPSPPFASSFAGNDSDAMSNESAIPSDKRTSFFFCLMMIRMFLATMKHVCRAFQPVREAERLLLPEFVRLRLLHMSPLMNVNPIPVLMKVMMAKKLKIRCRRNLTRRVLSLTLTTPRTGFTPACLLGVNSRLSLTTRPSEGPKTVQILHVAEEALATLVIENDWPFAAYEEIWEWYRFCSHTNYPSDKKETTYNTVIKKMKSHYGDVSCGEAMTDTVKIAGFPPVNVMRFDFFRIAQTILNDPDLMKGSLWKYDPQNQ